MILTICTEDKTYYYDEEKNLSIKETADIADASAVTVKVLIYEAEDYASVISISAEDTSVTSSSSSTLFSSNAFYLSWAFSDLTTSYIRSYSLIMNFSFIALTQSYITRGSQAFCMLPLIIFWGISQYFRVLYLIFLSKCSIICLHMFWRISQIFCSEYFFWTVLTVFNIIIIWLQRRIKTFLKKGSSISIIM